MTKSLSIKTEVEASRLRRYSSSTSVEGYRSQKIVRPLVRPRKVWENRSNDFPDFLHIVRLQKSKKRDTAGFLKKNPVHP